MARGVIAINIAVAPYERVAYFSLVNCIVSVVDSEIKNYRTIATCYICKGGGTSAALSEDLSVVIIEVAGYGFGIDLVAIVYSKVKHYV